MHLWIKEEIEHLRKNNNKITKKDKLQKIEQITTKKKTKNLTEKRRVWRCLNISSKKENAVVKNNDWKNVYEKMRVDWGENLLIDVFDVFEKLFAALLETRVSPR